MDFAHNRITHRGVKHLADLLIHNNGIIELHLENNEIGEEGAKYRTKSLCTNTVSFINCPYILYKNTLLFFFIKTLTTLTLDGDTTFTQGVQYIADILQRNEVKIVLLHYSYLNSTHFFI